MRDLKHPKAIYLKAVLFLFLGSAASFLLWMDTPTWKTFFLLGLSLWSFCRAYYFAFYVIERYVDPSFKFSGLWSFVRYILARK